MFAKDFLSLDNYLELKNLSIVTSQLRLLLKFVKIAKCVPTNAKCVLDPRHVIIWFVPSVLYESVRWLLSKGRNEESFKILNKIARVNNISPPADGFVLTLEDKTIRESAPNDVTSSPSQAAPLVVDKGKTYTVIDIFRSWVVLRNLVIMCLSW